jgi:hypothetical protein
MSILLNTATHTNSTGGAAMRTFRESEGLRRLLARLQADGGARIAS